MITKPFVGQRVAYSRQFVKSMGMGYSLASMRGEIIEIGGPFAGSVIVGVKWSGANELQNCLIINLDSAPLGKAVQGRE